MRMNSPSYVTNLLTISFFMVMLSALTQQVYAAQCEDVFPSVTTEYGSTLILPDFLDSTGVDGLQSGSNLSLEEGHYTDITVAPNGELTFIGTGDEYRADIVTIGQDAKVNFVAGDYYFSEFNMSEGSQLHILGAGTVRIYVENDINLETEALINDDEAPLLLITYNNFIGSTGIRFSGLLYAVNNITVDDSIDIHGAVTGLMVTLTTPEILDYVDELINNIDFNGTCTNTSMSFREGLVGYYPFEQSDFTENITDESGNNNHGVNLGGDVTLSGQYCNGFNSNGSNTSSLTANAFSTNIDVDDDVGLTGTISFWYQANNDWGDRDRTLFNASMINGENNNRDNKYFYLQIEGSSLSFEFENDDDDDFSISDDFPANIGNNGVWHYISVTWNLEDDEFQIYIDSDLLVERSEDDDGSDFDTDRSFGELGDIVFGDNSTDYVNGGRFTSADGNFDEVRIYDRVLSQSEIQSDMNENNCINTEVDHYQIHHAITGLTCEPETITIKACSNSFDSSNIHCDEIQRSSLVTINGNGNELGTLAFEASGEFSFNQTTAQNVVLSVSNENAAPVNCVEESAAIESNCHIQFSDVGFIFSTTNSSGVISGIENQISGKQSDVGFNAGVISIQAVETNTLTGACSPILIDQAIELAAQCNDDSSCISPLTIQATDIETTLSSPVTYTALDLGFSGADPAELTVNYPDAGALTLFARYNIPDINGLPSGNFIEGETNFIVKPFGFDVTINDTSTSPITNNPAAENSDGNVFIRAGNNFNVVLTAKQWQAVDDSNNDGIPDVGADLSDNNTTVNFKDDVMITHELVSPVNGVNADLSENTLLASAFIAGQQRLVTAWNEVGILAFNFHLLDHDYMGAGDVQTSIPFIGRFIPAYYGQVVEQHGTLQANDRDWVYSGETNNNGLTGAIRYGDDLPMLRITAYSSKNTITENYTIGGSFITLLATDIIFDTIESDDEQLGVDETNKVNLMASLFEGELATIDDNNDNIDDINGVLRYSMSNSDHFVYTKEVNSEIAPFTAQIPLAIDSLIDSDNVTYGTDSNNDALLESAIATNIEVRFGRLFIPNSYGPETEPLTIPMQLQVFDGVTYRINNDDSNTVLSTENNEVALIYAGTATDYLATGSASVNAVTSTPIQGYVYSILLTSDNNARGRVDLTYDVADWLKHDWDNDNSFDENPTASAQFGVFRGNDRILLWREISP